MDDNNSFLSIISCSINVLECCKEIMYEHEAQKTVTIVMVAPSVIAVSSFVAALLAIGHKSAVFKDSFRICLEFSYEPYYNNIVSVPSGIRRILDV